MKKKNKSFLVTGGTGFIGSNICKLLLKQGHKVLIYDNNSRGSLKKLSNIRNQVTFIKGDIRDKKKIFRCCGKVDAVIHLAYINGTKYFYTKPDLILDIAIKGLINVIDGCIKNKIKELYLASSSEVYQTPLKVPTREDEMLKIPNIYNPRYSYGGGKILTELMGIHYGKKFFSKLIIFRPHNVYGKNMGNEHVIPEFIKRFKKLKSKNFLIQGSGNEVRSFIYIKDFINAFELLLKRGKHLNIYNIGTSEKVKIKDLAYKLSKILKKKIILKKSPLKEGGTKIRIPDIKKIKKLGFKQKYNLTNGLKEILNEI
jgi:nucleoside-diphosphate-sugar epimerase